MGLDLTWRDEDRIKYGNCGRDLETIVHFRFPESSGMSNGGMSNSPERDSNYVVNDPELFYLKDLELPKGENGYAIEYTEMNLVFEIWC